MRAIALVIGWACGEADTPSVEPIVRDSAGIRIVENQDRPGSAWKEWSLGEEPVLQLGGLEDEPAYQFYRVVGAVTLSDGRPVIANGGTQEIRWYDADGSHEQTAGGEGQGPGEFTGLIALAVLPGDSVVAHDVRLRRLSVFDSTATFVRSTLLGATERAGMGNPLLVGSLADGSLLMAGRVLETSGMVEGPILSPMPLFRFGSDGIVRDSLGTFYGWEATAVIRRSAQFVAMAIADRPFGRSTSFAPVGDGFAAGTPFTFSYDVYDATGALRAIVRLNRANRPVTADHIAAYKASVLEGPRDAAGKRALRRQADDWNYPSTLPAYAPRLKGDRIGNVWVPAFEIGQEEPSGWSVFDGAGRYVAEVKMPARFRVFEIGDDYVLGIWRDDFDVEILQRFELRKR